MPHELIHRLTHWEDADLVLLSRVRSIDGAYITQSSISSIALKVYDLSDASLVGSSALTVSNVVFDTLQKDDRWTVDSLGYNFRATVPAAFFPTGGRDYRVEVIFTPTAGGTFPIVAEVSVQNLMSS